MSKKFTKKQLKKMNKSTAGGQVVANDVNQFAPLDCCGGGQVVKLVVSDAKRSSKTKKKG